MGVLDIVSAIHGHAPKNAINFRDLQVNVTIRDIRTGKAYPYKVEEKFEKYFGYLARCEEFFCTTTLKN